MRDEGRAPMTKPKTATRPKAAKPTEPDDEKTVRLVVEIPESVHRQLKSKAALEGKKLKAFVLDLLKAHGIG